jgi:phosphatidylglycerol:prolipoprotein diacylglycerol transferase
MLPDWIVEQMFIKGAYHHPTFLYESMWNLLGLVLILILRRKRYVRHGELLLGYLFWYGLGRFFVEGLREDSLAFQAFDWLASALNGLWMPMEWLGFDQGALPTTVGDVRASQLLSLLIVVGALTLFIWRRMRGLAATSYDEQVSKKEGDERNEAV